MTDEIAPVEVPAEPQQAAAPTVQSQFPAADDAEQSGLPLGSAQSADDVLAALVEHQNAFYDSLEGDDTDPLADPAPSEVESLRARLADQDATIAALQSQLESQLQQQRAEVARRLDREIDSWASPTLGVGFARTRTLKQTEAAQQFRNQVHQLVNGLAASGQPIPTIEEIARKLRPLADPSFNPAAKPPAPREPLGTPGTQRGGSKIGGEQPRTIHHALAQNPN